MFTYRVTAEIELRLIAQPQAEEFFQQIEVNRDHLRKWHPWVDLIRTKADVDRYIAASHQQFANNRGFHATVWQDNRLCGEINHGTIEWTHRWTTLSYWLDEKHQGRGIMTACCRAFVVHAFDSLELNRVTIECATDNVRSRAIPERLGFKLEGIVRQCERLQDRFVDHAVYGLLKSEFIEGRNAFGPAS